MLEDKLQDASADGGEYKDNGSAAHYKNGYFFEFMQEVEEMYGTKIAFIVSEVMSKKYRSRMGLKAGVSLEKDFIKSEFYRKLCQHYRHTLERGEGKLPLLSVQEFLEYSHFPQPLEEILYGGK
jgi:hypothetical protein